MINLDVIKARAAAATPGPWRWSGNVDQDDPRLIGGPRRHAVLGIVRRERKPEDRATKAYAEYLAECDIWDDKLNDGKGGHRSMTDAEIAAEVKRDWLEDPWGNPAHDDRLGFCDEPDVIFQYARNLAIFEVCPEATSRSDDRVYRADIVGLRSANATFIEHSRGDVDALVAEVESLRAIAARLAEELEDLSRGSCWKGERGFDACDSGGCVDRRALLDEYRALTVAADQRPEVTE